MNKYDLWRKEVLKENHIENIRKLAHDLALLEAGMLKRGYDRRTVNQACIDLIIIEDKNITRQLNEDFSDVVMGIVGRVAPGAKDYFKRQFLDYILSGMGVPTDSKLGSYIVEAFKNIDFLNIVKYFKTGNCPEIVNLVVNVLSDFLIKFVSEEIGKGLDSASGKIGGNSEPSAEEKQGKAGPSSAGSGGMEQLSLFPDDLSEAISYDLYLLNEQDSGLGKIASFAKGIGLEGMFGNENIGIMAKNFREATKGNWKGGVLQQIVMDIIKNDVLPILKNKLSEIICKDMDLSKFTKIVDNTFNRGQGSGASAQTGQAATKTAAAQSTKSTPGRVKQVSKPGQGGKRSDRA